MPVEYSGITDEHMAVRTRAGLFDVSHMGEIEVAGRDALAAVQRISCNDASKLAVGQAQYSGLMTADGTFVDDLLVYRLAPAHFLLVVNASRIDDDFRYISEQIKPVGDAVAVNASARYALLALQGPSALPVLQTLTGVDLAGIGYYWFGHGEVAGVRATISRTGYTGEDGFEVFMPPQSADRVWQAILDAGSDADVVIWDPEAGGVISASTHRQNCDTNVYEGFRFIGKPRIVIQRGRIACEDNQVTIGRGGGKYLYRDQGCAV
jgi:aminomethyltransferase